LPATQCSGRAKDSNSLSLTIGPMRVAAFMMGGIDDWADVL
jgi:hypothetical protein